MLGEKERIYVLKRRHPIVLIFQFLPIFLIFLLIFILILFLSFKKLNWPKFLIETFPELEKIKLNLFLIFLLSLVLPIFWTIIFLIIAQYYLTYWVVTNQRIIFVKFLSLFNVRYINVYLDKIQDLTVSIKGILPSVFRFGNLIIQTAGEKGQFLLDQIPEPEILKQIIFEAQKDYLKELKKS